MKGCRALIKYLGAWLVLVLIVGPIQAQELKKGVLERIVQPKLSLESAYLAPASVSGYGGEVGVDKHRIRLNNEIAGVSYTHWGFDWQGVDKLPFGNGKDAPIKQMHGLKVNVNLPYPVNDQWFVLTSMSLRSAFEKEMDGSYGGTIFGFASYRLDEDHALQMGGFANYHKVSTLALPALSYSYRARQKDGFSLVLGFPRAYAGYHVNTSTLIKVGAIFSQSVIRLSDASSIEAAGYIEAEDYMGNIGAEWEMNEHFRLEGNLLYGFKRNFIIYDANGDEQADYGIDASWGGSVKITWLF